MIFIGSIVFYKKISYDDSASDQLPFIAKVGPFELTNQEGRPFGLKELSGNIWVVNFIFTRCQGVCPVLTKKYLSLQKKLSEIKQLKYVSISMDPQFDQPSILKAFGNRYDADYTRWSFLTGKQDDIIQIARHLFKVPADKNPDLHSTRIVLIDVNSNIRGYYEGLDDKSIQKLMAHIRLLSRSDLPLS